MARVFHRLAVVALVHLAGSLGCKSTTSSPTVQADLPTTKSGSTSEAEASRESLAPIAATFLASYFDAGLFSGVAVVTRRSETIIEAQTGYRDFADRAPLSTNDTFHVASISKTFTAAAILALRNAGALALDDAVSEHLPDFPNGDAITIEQLLLHRSGLVDYWNRDDLTQLMQATSIELDALLTWIGEAPLEFAPGQGDRYSNSGYAVLAGIIAAASGEPYEVFVERELLRAAKLERTTRFRGDASTTGHQPAFGDPGLAPAAAYNTSLLVGAGSWKSSATDLARWCRAVLEREVSVSEPGEYPFGWGVRQHQQLRWLEQSGRNPGFSAFLAVFPDDELCVAVTSNVESEAIDEIGHGLAAIAYGQEPPLAKTRPHVAVAPELLDDLVGTYQISATNEVEVSRTDHGLTLTGKNGAPLPLEPIADDRFYFRQLDVEVGVTRDAAGEIRALSWGGSFEMPRR